SPRIRNDMRHLLVGCDGGILPGRLDAANPLLAHDAATYCPCAGWPGRFPSQPLLLCGVFWTTKVARPSLRIGGDLMRSSIRRSVAITLGLVAGAASAAALFAHADPGITVRYPDGVLWVQLQGSYGGATYTVYRSSGAVPGWSLVTTRDVLCIGDCYIRDTGAVPGQTYHYRFDLVLADG